MTQHYDLPDSDDDLLAQCAVATFCSGGKGGQHQNRTESGVRLRHIPSGVVVESRRERSQYMNKKICLANLRLKIDRLNYRAPKRKATRIPRSVKLKRLADKTHRAQKKETRSRPTRDD